MQFPLETSLGVSTPARRRRRTRPSPRLPKYNQELPRELSPPPRPVSVRAVGFPVSHSRRTGLQAKERTPESIPSRLLTRRPSGKRWRTHAPDYDDNMARIHLFKPPTPEVKRRVTVYYTCEHFILLKLLKWINNKAKNCQSFGHSTWKTTMYPEVLHSSFTPEIETQQQTFCVALQEHHVFVFASGCVVFWGLTRDHEAQVLLLLTPFATGLMDQVEAQEMEYTYGQRCSIAKETIVLDSTSVAVKLALSFALAQSATLGAFETRVEDRIRSTKHLPSSLETVGSIPYSQRDTSKLIGQLFLELADVNIHSSLLDEPEYFFKTPSHDDLKYLYEKMCKYQDVANRVAILNKRLSVLRDLVGVLNQQLTHYHGTKLEWIVIWILVFQVIIAIGWEVILKDIFQCFG